MISPEVLNAQGGREEKKNPCRGVSMPPHHHHHLHLHLSVLSHPPEIVVLMCQVTLAEIAFDVQLLYI